MDPTGESVNEAGFRAMLRYLSEAGTNVFVGGPHATEFVNMGPIERRRLWEVAVDELKGKGQVNAIPFGPASTTDMIGMFKLAREVGFDGAQLYPGAEMGQGADGLFVAEAERYYRDVLEAMDFPMYLCGYHGGEIIDAAFGLFPYERLAALATEYPHIVGVTVMEGGRDESELKELIRVLAGKPVRLAGALDWFQKLELGIYGFHSIQQSIAPKLCSSFLAAHQAGDHELSRELSAKLRRLNEIVHDHRYHYPRSIKPILSHLGFEMGSIRRPYLPPATELQLEMQRRVDELGLDRIESLPARF
jgi:dihydrodipicolinate synthase/N-acetylneuraminate lyase